MSTLLEKAREPLDSFLANAIVKTYTIFLYEYNEANLESFGRIITFFEKQLNLLQQAFKISFL